MRRLSLFWRNFLAFWAGMAAIAAIGMALTAAVAWQRFASLDGLSPATLARDARQVASAEGRAGLRRWLQAMDSHGSALRIYVVERDNRDILGRDIEPRKRSYLAELRAQQDHAQAQGGVDPLAPWPRADGTVSWWDPQVITLPDGDELLMTFLPFDSSRWEVLSLSPVAWSLALFALGVSAPLCWVLARQVANPVQALRQVAGRLAGGALDARTPAALHQRGDDLGQLARDFDAMSVRLQEMVAAREQLLRNVAHELRSPLARLRIASELAMRGDATAALQFGRIEREIGRLDDLVGHTLALARAGAGAVPAAPIDLGALVDGVVCDARFEAADRGAAIAWESVAPGAAMVRADAAGLASAIENVLRNALHHTGCPSGDGSADIRVDLCVHAARVEITVSDNGPGVPPEALAHLFEPFYRVRSDPRGARGGAGLGLSIAQASVRAHGGGISAHNGVPRGLVVRLWLPREGGQGAGLAAPGRPYAEGDRAPGAPPPSPRRKASITVAK